MRSRDRRIFEKNRFYELSSDRKFNADFEFEVKNLFLPRHIRENRVLKNCVGESKNFDNRNFDIQTF